MRLFAGSSPAMRRTTFSRSTAKATRSAARQQRRVHRLGAQLLSEELLPVRHIVVWRPTQAARPSTRSSEKSEDSLPAQVAVYFNYCTLSYTAAWWDWNRWQRRSTSWPSTASTCRWPLPGWKPSGITRCYSSSLAMRRRESFSSARRSLRGNGCLISKAIAARCRKCGSLCMSIWPGGFFSANGS